MALQIRRGLAADLPASPADGELLYAHDTQTLYVGHSGTSHAIGGGITLTNLSVTDSGGDGSLSYNNTTGVFTYTGPSAANVRAHFSAGSGITYNSSTGVITSTGISLSGLSVTDSGGDGSLSYDNTTGVFTYTGPSATEVRNHFSAGTGVTITTGSIAIGQAVGTGDNVTFNDLTVSGNLTVSGTTTTVNTETINLADNTIVLNSNATGSASENAGIEVERGDDTNKSLVWDETNDRWTVGSETFVAGTFQGNIQATNSVLTANALGNVTGATTINLNSGNYITATVTGATTWTISNVASGAFVNYFILELINGGSATQTWMSGIKWPGGTAPTLTASGTDILAFISSDNGTTWRGVASMVDSK